MYWWSQHKNSFAQKRINGWSKKTVRFDDPIGFFQYGELPVGLGYIQTPEEVTLDNNKNFESIVNIELLEQSLQYKTFPIFKRW